MNHKNTSGPPWPAGGLDSSTLPPSSESEAEAPVYGGETLGLVVLWSSDEPTRIGETLLIPTSDSRPWVFGRGDARPEERRLFLVRQRPGVRLQVLSLCSLRISRSQLRLTATTSGGLLVENVGSCPMMHNGREVTRAELLAGDIVALRGELMFLCVHNAALLPMPPDERASPLHPFGEADGFGLVGESAPIWELRRRIHSIARQPFHVLVLGASGAGKELVVQAIHTLSSRGHRGMVSRNAATIPAGLADAELFGNVRSYPNPGMPERAGLVGEAHQSTLFLDELGELPAAVQAHLLRVMDDGEYQRLGEATMRRSDLRFIGATNRPQSHIKHDVLARLKLRVTVPDLNARREDIPLLVVHLLRRLAAADPVIAQRFFPAGDTHRPPQISPTLIEALVKHEYETNVRELDTLLLSAALEGRGRYLELTPELKRVISSPLPPRPAGNSLTARMTADETTRLELLRKHSFSATACGRDPAYPGNRQTADLHLRFLLCKALKVAEWDADAAAALLAGDVEQRLREKSKSRLETFLSNLRARVEGATEGELRRALLEEWKGNTGLVLEVIEALRRGQLSVTGASPRKPSLPAGR